MENGISALFALSTQLRFRLMCFFVHLVDCHDGHPRDATVFAQGFIDVLDAERHAQLASDRKVWIAKTLRIATQVTAL